MTRDNYQRKLIFFKYSFETLKNHTNLKNWDSFNSGGNYSKIWSCFPAMYQKRSGGLANSAYPDQTEEQSDLDLHYLPRSFYPNVYYNNGK